MKWKLSTRALAAFLSAILVVTLGQAAGAAAPSTVRGVPHRPQQEQPVPVSEVPVRAAVADPASGAELRAAPAVAWPDSGVALARAGALVNAGGLPVRLGAAGKGVPESVRVEVLDRAAAARAGVRGLLVRLARADGVKRDGKVTLTVDYGRFRHAYGGNWGDRLRLVRLADRTPVPSRNDPRSATVTATVGVTGDATTYALTAGPSGSTGSYTATPLALSSSWQVSGQTGEFTWTYPLRMPQTPGGLVPRLAISYSSGSVDGRTAATNNQPSWVGEGFDLWSGYIERSYRSCADDPGGNQGQTKTGDQCWHSDNATMSLAGHSGQLVRDDATGVWRLKADDGSRIEKLTGTVNGDDNGEYWKLTTREGVQYFFGLNRLPGWSTGRPETGSAWQAPVFGNHSGEPCHAATYASSWCRQTYRWNLDYIVDTHGNTLTYYYVKQRNSYGLNLGSQTVAYDRGGVLARAEFGTRQGSEYTTPAPAKVVFATADRCVPGADCTKHTPQSYPDVPFDQECASGCTTQVSPTFWTTKRLASITTQVGSAIVERWTLAHSFPDPGDSTSAGLWLASITHSGHVGGTVTMPAVTFAGEAKPNRVNGATDGLPPLNKFRVIAVNNESGGTTGINYAPVDCFAQALPTPDHNTSRCFPVYWQPEGGQALTDWMHRYVVSSVTQVDRVGGSPTETTSYEYLGGGAWHYNDNEVVTPERRTWSQWRGYQRLIIRKGDPGGPRSMVEHRYFRGMNGDRLAGGGTRPASIVDSQGNSVLDEDWFNGRMREKITYNGSGGPVLGSTITDLWQRGPTATHGSLKAYMVDTAAVHERTALDGGRWRRTKVTRSYNDDGMVTRIDDHGDLDVSGDEECTRTWYTRVTLPVRVEAVAASCGATPSYPADALSDVRTTYDAAGGPTKVEHLSGYSGGEPVYVTVTRTTFDAYGRPLDSYDALGRKTATSYTETNGITTEVKVTNALGHATRTVLAAAWGEPVTSFDPDNRRTDVRYDALGRVTGVWLPGRSEPAGQGPNLRYHYTIRTGGVSAVATDTLRANGNYVTSYALYDGFLRSRQTQAPAWGGGRVITDTIYDSRGLVVKTNDNYYAEGTPGATLVAAGDNNIPAQTVTEYDGADRAIASVFRSLDVDRWRSTTSYHGDRVDRTPPPGGTATSVHLDAEGRTVALSQYHAPTPTGPADITRYTYTNTGQLATVTDPAGNQWRYDYDLRGRRVGVHDPDRGDSTAVFDAAGQLLSATDARGATIAYKYDVLGRKIEERDGSPTGALRAKWTYDTLLLGKITSSTRVNAGSAFTTAVVGYDAANRPTGTRISVPASQGALAGTYQTNLTYRPDGSVASVSLPRAGDLPPETVTFEYDDLGLPKKTGGASDYVNDTWYTRFSELAQVSAGAAGARVWRTLYYDEATRRLSRSLVERETSTGAQVNDFRYRYDPAGNVTRIADVPEGGPADTQCFTYDYLRRMTEAWTVASACAPGSPGGTNAYWTSYRYDVTGNRTSEIRHGLNGAADTTRTYHYDRPHALASVSTEGPAGSALDTFGYDATGNTTTRVVGGVTQHLTWDPLGLFTSSTPVGGAATTIAYDADGNRLVRSDPVATTLYLGAQQIRLHHGSGAVTGTRFYSHGGQVVAVRNGSGLHWRFGDHHGTATTTIEAGTLAVTRRLFTPFGDTRGTAPASWPDEHGFVGGTRDESVGLIQLGAREYDPDLGRFISVDPVIDHQDPQQLNGYVYSNNSPATFSDPDGLRYFVDVEGRVSIPSLKYATAKQIKRAQDKAAKITRANIRYKRELDRRRDAAIQASGHTKEEYEEALEIKKKSVLDVVIEAGGEVLKEFLGINDIKGCFGEGDIGSCISMVINVIPWSKIFRIGELIGAVKRAWKAVTSFRSMRKHADEVIAAVRSCSVGNSFATGTRVLMADGSSKRIEALKVGDTVAARDPQTGAVGEKAVAATIVGQGRKIFVEVTLGGKDKVVATDNHPFWAPDLREWIPATQLHVGSWLQTSAGTWVQVTAIKRWTRHATVHNLTVTDIHTYYVLAGDTQILVHNCGGATLLGRKADIDGYRDSKPGADFDADFLNIRGTMAGGKKGVGGWNWTRNKRFIDDALDSGREVRLVTDPDAPLYSGGNVYQRELKYLRDRGYGWQSVDDHWTVVRVRP